MIVIIFHHIAVCNIWLIPQLIHYFLHFTVAIDCDEFNSEDNINEDAQTQRRNQNVDEEHCSSY